MEVKKPGEVTRLLKASSAGETEVLEKLLPLVYEEMRNLAHTLFQRERSNHTLQPTALIHETYLRMVGQENIEWQNRAHFFGIAANLMRQILVNYANARNAEKRGGKAKTIIQFDEAISFASAKNLDILDLHDALEMLEKIDKRQARIVELKFFGGLNIEEIAEVLKISESTVKREWKLAKLWLYKTLND